MSFVLTLIAPESATVDHAIVGEVRAALNALGAETGEENWLAPERAIDVYFERLQTDQAEAAVLDVLSGARIDVIAQSTAHRKKSLLLADMDSTFVTSETLDDLAGHAGLEDVIAAITVRAMNGEIDFAGAVRERVGMLAGLPEEALEDTWQKIELSPGAETAAKTMRANGATCILISGGFDYFTSRVADICGFHENMANAFEIEDGKLTGKVIEPILTKDVKLQTLISRAADLQLPIEATVCIGDGANDTPMLKAAGLGIAYHGKPSVREEASARLDHADLTGLLFAQGYREDEFVRGPNSGRCG